jgi:DNA invertase Pin-like site-specific DNA recombinase
MLLPGARSASSARERTKAALAAARARGVKLGGDRHAHKLTDDACAMGRAVVANRARQRAADIARTVAALRAAGTTSLRGIAAELNNRGIPTVTGAGSWRAAQVRRLLARI